MNRRLLRQARDNDVRDNFGKYFFDLSKLFFGGVVLGSVFHQDIAHFWVICGIGGLGTAAFAVAGYFTIKSKYKKGG
ncbi:hypothetical protein FACS1894139_01910 [Planctomycetales bacterium]|nr:hypothetical protein FACS1894107_10650 [Planctomycetales bacterium]GHS96797.1 hypothetical protein FACS1894108_02030 [Planctomycetales bacterium]GHT02872.1 hypothetical protein FACS1894139_01910 [Planctomycetales bacterium]GHV23812.1 hypothetical protein AGMMS49959_18200 [Planctomycetales bacterium]